MKKGRKGEKEKGRLLLQSFAYSFLFFVFFVCFAGKSSAQNLETLAEQIKFGTTEIKRDALSQIRNLQNENASRIAIPALSDKEEIVRATAAFAVIYLPQTEAFSALSPLLFDKSEIVRRETAYALGKNQNVSAVNLLIQTFQRDKISDVKNACIVALGEIGDVSAIDFLTQILRQKPSDKNEFLRRSVSRSIGQIAQIIQIRKSQVVTPKDFLPDKYQEIELPKYSKLTDEFPVFRETLPLLTQVLQNPKESNDTKREAAFALGAIGDESAISILQTNLNNQDYYLAEICKESLRKIEIAARINENT